MIKIVPIVPIVSSSGAHYVGPQISSSSSLGGVWGVARRHIRELFFSFVRLCSYTSHNRGALRGKAAFGFSVSRDLLIRMDRSIRTTTGAHSSLGPAEYFCYQHLFVGVNSREGRLCASPDTRILVERKFSNENMPPQLHNENILGCRIRILMKGGVYVAGTTTESLYYSVCGAKNNYTEK